ncbi:cysteine desulfurase [uncultured Limosilactobacillus sp.]|uniref:cysteine desulfurase n=1 Tax=uncultured Limosilactobacillus sp. TaxID=2837629 RepID=UPI0025EECDB5|nr:cysteine desulfurase [uncultured Limosilactobacillus sp.]
MEFQHAVQLIGDSDTYMISSQIKEYTLIDLGFERTKRGNYRYLGSLDRQSPFKPFARLQITVNGELSGFKMSTVSTNGTRIINIFNQPRREEFVTQLHFILDEMVQRGIFDKK